jgi:hypothetical protein
LRRPTSAHQRVLPAPGSQSGLLAWLSATQLLYITYSGQERAANRSGALYLLDVDSGDSRLLAQGVAEPRCFPVCNYQSLVVFYRP